MNKATSQRTRRIRIATVHLAPIAHSLISYNYKSKAVLMYGPSSNLLLRNQNMRHLLHLFRMISMDLGTCPFQIFRLIVLQQILR